MPEALMSGLIKDVNFQIFAQDVALVVNGQGKLVLSCPEDVFDIDLESLSPVDRTWPTMVCKADVTHKEDYQVARIYRAKGDGWEYIVRLARWI